MLQGRNAAGKKNNSVDRIANRDQQTVSQVAWWRGVVDSISKPEAQGRGLITECLHKHNQMALRCSRCKITCEHRMISD